MALENLAGECARPACGRGATPPLANGGRRPAVRQPSQCRQRPPFCFRRRLGRPRRRRRIPTRRQRPRHDGALACHLRPGKHDLTAADWSYCMDYTDRHWPAAR
ncbi:MAG: hypothetical protein LBI02_06880 [Opitutaceae bacterium]|nr:hypothetical protein [Opitutaceae bacterium]